MNATSMKCTNDTSSSSARLLSLKPLRDLAQNWDVDIASCLQEYLQQLERAGHSVNVDLPAQLLGHNNNADINSDTTTNFAQAAVLLQNSSSVYGRKVEYLHSLVYAALEKLLASSANRSANGKNRNSSDSTPSSSTTKNTSRNDEDVLRFQAFDPDCQFLLLDDVLPIDSTGTKINLKPSMNTMENEQLGESNVTDDENAQFNTTRLSLGGSLSVTRVEATTPVHNQIHLPPTTSNGSINNTGDTPAAANNAMIMETLFSEGGGGGGGNLRLMSGVCDINYSGALIMPGANYKQSEHQTISDCRKKGYNTLNDDVDGAATLTGEKLDLSVEGGLSSTPTGVKDGLDYAERGDVDNFGDYDDHDNDDGVGFDLAQNNNEQEIGTPLASNEQQQVTLRQQFAGDAGDGKVLLGITSKSIPSENNMVVITAPSKQNPWLMLDPHSTEKSKHKPLQVGITYHLPHGLQDTPSNSVTGSHTKSTSSPQSEQEPRALARSVNQKKAEVDDACGNACLAVQAYRATLHLAEYESKNNSSGERKRQCSMAGTCDTSEDEPTDSLHDFLLFASSSNMPCLSLKHLAYGEEFLYVAKAQKKQKAAERRKFLKLQVEQNAESSDAAIVQEKFNHVHNDDDDNDGGDEGDIFRIDDGGDDYDDNNDDNCNGMDNASPKPAIGNSDFVNFDNVFSGENNNKSSGFQTGGGNITATSQTIATFDALCRAHLHEFAKGAEKYAIETQLSKRVKTWQNKLAVILDEEEERLVFNIRTYQIWTLNTAAKVLKKNKKCVLNKVLMEEKQHKDQQESNNNLIDFVSITRNKEPHEVSRIFLTSLMLCNTNNTEFRPEHADEVATPDGLKLELLSFKFESRIDNYLS